MTSLDPPRLIANDQLRTMRLDANLSWNDFNTVWNITTDSVTTPANDVLLYGSAEATELQEAKLNELTSEILRAGLFGPGTRARWRPDTAPGRLLISQFIGDLVAHVAEAMKQDVQMIEQTFSVAVETNNVHRWLMWENPEMYDDRVPVLQVAATEDRRTVVSYSSSAASDRTIVPGTVCDAEEEGIGC